MYWNTVLYVPSSVSQPRRRRLSRQEARAVTRQRLLDAAADVFSERGFAGASVEDIAERAGYTRGAFYSNFADKAAVFLAVLDARTRVQIAEIGGLLRDAESPAEAFTRLRERDASRSADPTWSLLSTELWLYAMRNPSVRPRLAEHQRLLHDAYKRAIKAELAAAGVEPPVPIDDLAVIVHVLDEGITAQHRLDPQAVREGFLFDALAMLLDAAKALAEKRAGARVTGRRRPKR